MIGKKAYAFFENHIIPLGALEPEKTVYKPGRDYTEEETREILNDIRISCRKVLKNGKE